MWELKSSIILYYITHLAFGMITYKSRPCVTVGKKKEHFCLFPGPVTGEYNMPF